jgi:hypothetical protein
VSTSSGFAEYTVVLRAHSAARFVPEEGWAIVMDVPNLGLKRLRIRTWTRWVNEAGKELPRELIVEARGPAGSLHEATAKFAAVARPIATLAGFVANVLVGPLECAFPGGRPRTNQTPLPWVPPSDM